MAALRRATASARRVRAVVARALCERRGEYRRPPLPLALMVGYAGVYRARDSRWGIQVVIEPDDRDLDAAFAADRSSDEIDFTRPGFYEFADGTRIRAPRLRSSERRPRGDPSF